MAMAGTLNAASPLVLEPVLGLAAQLAFILPTLSAQDTGMSSSKHVEQVVTELFEKAATQHHFVEAYADLCKQLQNKCSEKPISVNEPDQDFRAFLLAGCQASFERAFARPKGLRKLDAATRDLVEQRCKNRILGTILFVSALLVRDLLPPNIFFVLLDALLQDATPQAMEPLATLLTAVGPVFDNPDWAYHVALNAVFEQVRRLAENGPGTSRDRRPLKVVLAVRAAGWQREEQAKTPPKARYAHCAGRRRHDKVGSPTSRSSKTTLDDLEQESTCGDSTPTSSEADVDF